MCIQSYNLSQYNCKIIIFYLYIHYKIEEKKINFCIEYIKKKSEHNQGTEVKVNSVIIFCFINQLCIFILFFLLIVVNKI